MAYRKRLKKSQSKKSFKKGMGTHVKNLKDTPTRGGIRL